MYSRAGKVPIPILLLACKGGCIRSTTTTSRDYNVFTWVIWSKSVSAFTFIVTSDGSVFGRNVCTDNPSCSCLAFSFKELDIRFCFENQRYKFLLVVTGEHVSHAPSYCNHNYHKNTYIHMHLSVWASAPNQNLSLLSSPYIVYPSWLYVWLASYTIVGLCGECLGD